MTNTTKSLMEPEKNDLSHKGNNMISNGLLIRNNEQKAME